VGCSRIFGEVDLRCLAMRGPASVRGSAQRGVFIVFLSLCWVGFFFCVFFLCVCLGLRLCPCPFVVDPYLRGTKRIEKCLRDIGHMTCVPEIAAAPHNHISSRQCSVLLLLRISIGVCVRVHVFLSASVRLRMCSVSIY
jgi:hypothetical protein